MNSEETVASKENKERLGKKKRIGGERREEGREEKGEEKEGR